MCGIAGYFSIDREIYTDEVIWRMTRAIAHRGPDDEGLALFGTAPNMARNLSTDVTAAGVTGTYPSGNGGWPHRVAFGHRRFSIIDLTSGAHQPFWSSNGRVCVCFNGELYNYVELRRELERLGHRFRTMSDTEVLAEAYLQWGTEAFQRFVGFWALSLYDASSGRVLLARDRLGKASLYTSTTNGMLWWSSEIKGILAGAGDAARVVREQAVSDFVIRGWRDIHEQTFFEKIETFPRASWSWIAKDGTISPIRYWTVPDERLAESEISSDRATEGIRDRLGEALRVRFRADVPVGFELSGGLDSSTLFAIGASQGHRIHAFTITYPGTDADEERYARKVHERYPHNTDLEVVQQQVTDFFDSADEIVGHMDEPFHSPNILSITRIWQDMRRMGIRVTIKGDAGDELFAGYPGVYYKEFLWELAKRGKFGKLHREATLFSEDPTTPFSSSYFRRLASVAAAGLRQHGGPPRQFLANVRHMRKARAAGFRAAKSPQVYDMGSIEDVLLDRIGDWQMNYWLRVGNLASLSVPIEIRAPFLDHRVIEFVFRLPTTYLIRDGWLKWILRQAMKDMLPAEIVWRPAKTGFPFPYRHWLAHSKDQFVSTVGNTEVPYVDVPTVVSQYDRLVGEDPLLLWRLIITSLWWKRCVSGDNL